jgi:hypothetical protein
MVESTFWVKRLMLLLAGDVLEVLFARHIIYLSVGVKDKPTNNLAHFILAYVRDFTLSPLLAKLLYFLAIAQSS